MSGGGSAGKVGFPAYMEQMHEVFLGERTGIDPDLVDIMTNALGTGGNPWEGVTLTDPSSDFSDVQTRYNTYETEVDSIDEEADWDSIIDNAVAKVDQSGVLEDLDTSGIVSAARSGASTSMEKAIQAAVDAINDDIIKDAVEAYRKRSSVQKQRAVNRFSATMADINAVNSSAYMFGLAIIEAQHLQDVDQHQSDMELQIVENFGEYFRSELEARLRTEVVNKNSREQLIQSGAQLMANILSRKLQSMSDTLSLLTETKRLKTVATREYELTDADLDYKFSTWDFEVYNHGISVLGGITGPAAKFPAQPSTASSAIGGALSGGVAGAQAGASIGSGAGPWGAGIGAVLGAGSALLNE